MFRSMGDGAHIQVHSQIRAALRGTVPTPGSVAVSAKSVALKAACTSATGMPKAPKLASSSELKGTSRLTLQGLPALPVAPSARDRPFCGRERQDAFRADVARLVQAMRHHLPTRDVEPGATALLEPVQHLASLLAADAPAAHLQEAALAVVDSYDWPSPEASSGGEGPVIDAAILAAVERLRDAMDALDLSDDDARRALRRHVPTAVAA